MANSRGVPTGQTMFDVSLSGANVTIATQAAAGNCTFTAPFNANMQYGQHQLLAGNFSCTNGTSGTFFFDDFDVTFSGFTASYSIDGYIVGTLAGARMGLF
jgi:hypothetical protein